MDRRTRRSALSRLSPGALLAFALPAAALLPGVAAAEVLLVERVQAEPASLLPARGLSMAEVRARFGEPMDKLEPRGGQKAQWPVIHRWTYPAFTVYFERDIVIDAVADRAIATETGPLPPVR